MRPPRSRGKPRLGAHRMARRSGRHPPGISSAHYRRRRLRKRSEAPATVKLLITGAFGNLGLMCVERALSMGHRVVGLDLDRRATRSAAAAHGARIEAVFGDVRDGGLVRRAVEDVDAVLHNASVLPPGDRGRAGPRLGDQRRRHQAALSSSRPTEVFKSDSGCFHAPRCDRRARSRVCQRR